MQHAARSGLPGFDLESAKSLLFQTLVQVQGELWKDLVVVYQRYPWRLLPMIYSGVAMEAKLALAADFLTSNDCDIDPGFTKCLKDFLATGGFNLAEVDPAAILQEGSIVLQVLTFLSMSKSSNVEVECNFARASSARQAMRGRCHLSSTMSSKHILAELTHLHHMQHPPKKSSKQPMATFSRGVYRKLEPQTATRIQTCRQLTDQPDDRQKKKKSCKLNGWILFYEARLKSRPGRLHESKEERRQRIFKEASADFKLPEFAAERRRWSAKAKEMNREFRENRARGDGGGVDADANAAFPLRGFDAIRDQARRLELEREADGMEAASESLAVWDGKHGPWGISDSSWPVSKEVLGDSISNIPGFVKSYSQKWCNSQSSIVFPDAQHQSRVEASKSKRDEVSFCGRLGGCFQKVPAVQQTNILRNLELFRNLVRHLRHGNQRGCGSKAPLLVLASPKLPGGDAADPRFFLLVKAQFRPYDVVFWRCEIENIFAGQDCEHVNCPRSFDLTLMLCWALLLMFVSFIIIGTRIRS